MKSRKLILFLVCLSVIVIFCRDILFPRKLKFPGETCILCFKSPNYKTILFLIGLKLEILFNQQGKFTALVVLVIFFVRAISDYLFAF